MLRCTTGRVQEIVKAKKSYYRLRLNIVDDTGTTRKERYKSEYISTDLLVGGKTNGIKNEYLANEMLTQEIRNYTPVGSNMKFSKYCEYWLDQIQKSHDIEQITKEGYAYKVGYIIRHFSAVDKSLSEITTDDLRDFMNSLYEVKRTATSQRNARGLSDRSVRDIMVMAKQIFTYAIDNGHLNGRNPSAPLKLPKKKKKTEDAPFITEEDIPAFKQALRDNCDGNIILEYAYLIALTYGLRRSELCGLRWSAIRNGNIYIEHTVTHMKKIVAKDRTKTEASNRSCALVPQAQEIFERIKTEQESNRKLFGNTYHNNDYVFTWQDGRPFDPDYLSKKFRKIVDKSDLPDKRLHLHDLRASCVSILINQGVNIKDVQKWVGHEDIQTTMNIYARTNRQHMMETGKTISSIVFD